MCKLTRAEKAQRRAYRRQQVEYRRELADSVCPCNASDTMCRDCREAYEATTQHLAATVES